ncbi:MAG: PAS domain S-box protein, partial [Dehalococcoidales bacterium]|nr:PAS domain S-box protein [Dehalococcoidales bacterium]
MKSTGLRGSNPSNLASLAPKNLPLILNTISEGLIVINPQRQIVLINRAAREILDLKRARVVGKDYVTMIGNIYHPDGAKFATRERPFVRMLTGGSPLVDEIIRYQTSAGKSIWIKLKANHIKLADSGFTGVVATFSDITTQINTEERNRHLTTVLKAIRNVNQLITQEKNPAILIKQACRLLIENRGFENAWILLVKDDGKFQSMASSGRSSNSRAFIANLKKGINPACINNLRKSKQPFIALESASLQCRGCNLGVNHHGNGAFCARLEFEGQIYGYLIALVPPEYVHDPEEISLFQEVGGDLSFALAALEKDKERQKLNEIAIERERRYHFLLDGMLEGCQIIGFDWQYLYLNDMAANHSHSTRKQLLGRTMMDVYPGIEKTKMFAALRDAMENRKPHQMENEFVFPDGSRGWYDLNIEPVDEGIFILSQEVTTQKKLELERESLARFPSENPNPVMRIDRGGRIVYANAAAKPLLQFWGVKRQDYLPPKWLKLVREINRSQKSKNLEITHRDRIFSLTFQPVPQADYLNIYGRDITRQRKAEEILQQQRDQLLKFASQVPGMLYQFVRRTDGTYFVPYTNDKISDVFGCLPEDVKDSFEPIARVILPEDLPRVLETIEYSAAHLTPWTCEYRVNLPGHETITLWGQSVPEALPDGSIAWFGFNTDITERIRTEKAARENADKFQAIFENSNEAILLTNPNGQILGANTAACRMFNRSEPEIIKIGRRGLMDPSDPRMEIALEERRRTGEFRGELLFLRRDGTKFPGEITSKIYTDMQ